MNSFQQWPRPLTSDEITYLHKQGYTSGMIEAFPNLAASTPLRIWIIDNGHLQQTRDATRITGTFEGLQSIDNQSRWDETMDCVAYHTQMYTLYRLPTKLILLNAPIPPAQQACSVGEGTAAEEVRILKQTMTTVTPSGPSHLAQFINHCTHFVSRVAPQLLPSQRIALILATQGRPTVDPGSQNETQVVQEFLHAIQSLASYPVWVVVRLTTNDESTFDFYNDLDKTPGLGFDVLDDFFGEALEIYFRNPWLSYGLPLHRMRESGFRIDVLDEIDERPLTYEELKALACLLFGSTGGLTIPDPRMNWGGFLNAVSVAQSREKAVWNPIRRRLTPWIDLKLLNQMYGQGNVPLQTTPGSNFATMHAAAPVAPAGAFMAQQQQMYQQQQQPVGNAKQSFDPYGQASMPSQQQQQTQQSFPTQPFPQAMHSTPPPQQQQQRPTQQPSATPGPSSTSPNQSIPIVGQKYAATEASQDTSTLKRNILIQWALSPPSYSKLQSIDKLISSVQTIFPPSFGVAQHEYFHKWKPVTHEALLITTTVGDDDDAAASSARILKRAIRKLKFFLHPDKIPKDLDTAQSFLLKMIWDVVADAEAAANL